MEEKINKVQEELRKQDIDGWLFFDFRKSNELAWQFLEIPQETHATRRFFYWIPKEGQAKKIESSIEACLSHLPGEQLIYRSWRDLVKHLNDLLKDSQRIIMEYSPKGAIPYVSKVDAGTVELIQDCGVSVLSSADLLQMFTCLIDASQKKTHIFAANVLDQAVDKAWDLIAKRLKAKKAITEMEVRDLMIQEIQSQWCIFEGNPMCAAGKHSAMPHYTVTEESNKVIEEGDFMFLDLWCKQNTPKAIYADITQVGVALDHPNPLHVEIFNLVKKARAEATLLVKNRFANDELIYGWEVDATARKVIEEGGYETNFIHKTGHNIGIELHGDGAQMDSLETQEERRILPGTCFSIEPGIYLPNCFGVRLEYDVFVDHDKTVSIYNKIQEDIISLL